MSNEQSKKTITRSPLGSLAILATEYKMNVSEFFDGLVYSLSMWSSTKGRSVPESDNFFSNANAFNEMEATYSTEPQGAVFHFNLTYPLTEKLKLVVSVEYLWKEKYVLGKMTWINIKVINADTPSIPLAAAQIKKGDWPDFEPFMSFSVALNEMISIKCAAQKWQPWTIGMPHRQTASSFVEYITVGPFGDNKETFIRTTNPQSIKAEENKMHNNSPVVEFIAEQKNKHQLDLSKFALIVGGALTFWLDGYGHTRVADKLFKMAEGFENMAVQPLLRPSKEGAINGMEFRHPLKNDLEFVIETWFWPNVKLAQIRVFVQRVPSSSRIQVRSDNPQMSIIDFHVKLEDTVSYYVNTSIPMIGGIKAVLEKAELLASVTKTPEQLDKVTSNAELPHALHEKITPVIDSAIDFSALGEAMRKKRIQMDWAEAERIIRSEILQQYAPNAAKNLCQEIPLPDSEGGFKAEYARNEQMQNTNLAIDKEHREYLLSLLKSQQGMCDYISLLPRHSSSAAAELVRQLEEFTNTLKVKFVTPTAMLVKKKEALQKAEVAAASSVWLRYMTKHHRLDINKFATAVTYAMDHWERHYGNKIDSEQFFQDRFGFGRMTAQLSTGPGKITLIFSRELNAHDDLIIETTLSEQKGVKDVTMYVKNSNGLALFKTVVKRFPRATFEYSEIPAAQNLLEIAAALQKEPL